MSTIPPVRADLELMEGYHSAQVEAEVRLNTNESPFPPPPEWQQRYQDELARIAFHRYPDRDAMKLRRALGALHGVEANEVFCANGSNEALQCLLLAFGGFGRRVVTFEPTYALHSHIARLTGAEVVRGERTPDFVIETGEVDRVVSAAEPSIVFLCSPNNPTGRAEPESLVRYVVERAPGLVVVDEAYGQFSPWSAQSLRGPQSPGLVLVRTFSKTWSMAASRLGYLIADPAVVAACEHVALPYHLSATTQAAGLLALDFRDEMAARVAVIAEERGRLSAALAELPVETWPSDANFVLFRPLDKEAARVWSDLLARSVLVRDCSSWEGLPGCLRVTVGTPEENDRFVQALKESLS